MVDYFRFNNRPSTDFGIVAGVRGNYSAPERVYESVTIPGRNGELLIDQKRYENIDVTYDAVIYENFYANAYATREWLLSVPGYARLEDTANPEEFRMAKYKGAVIIDTQGTDAFGKMSITFSCKPQRFLKSGETAVTVSSGGTLVNPSKMEALPNIRVYGYGTLRVGTETITISQHSFSYIDIDCDAMDAHYGSSNANRYITVTNFPKLKQGSTSVSFSGNITGVQITPKWWRL